MIASGAAGVISVIGNALLFIVLYRTYKLFHRNIRPFTYLN
jgi:hypothetical protein